jgi:hypothetical protein
MARFRRHSGRQQPETVRNQALSRFSSKRLISASMSAAFGCSVLLAGYSLRVRAWMEAIYRRLVSTPQSIQMMTISRGPTVAWVRASVALRRSLADSGLKNAELAEAVFWVGVTVAGFVQQTLARPLPELIEATSAAINKLEPDEIAELAPLGAEVPRIFRQGFDIMIERTLASVEKLIDPLV